MSDLDNQQRGEAGSLTELADRKPDELFEPEFAERYERLQNDLWQRMTRIDGIIVTLETMADFPFNDLYGPNDMEFWRMVGQNFFEMTFVLLHGLVRDEGEEKHTLINFKSEIVNRGSWLDPRMRELFRQKLRDIKFDSGVNSVLKRVKRIRGQRIVHRLFKKQTRELEDQSVRVSFPELKELFVAAKSLFDALSFGSKYETLAGDLMPSKVGGKPTRTCLDKVLDAVIRDSAFVNQPEWKSQWWRDKRKLMAPETLRIMNELRKRVGLPEV